MPLVPAQIAASIISASSFPGGPTWPLTAQAIGRAISIWGTSNPANLAMAGITTGSAGAGTVLGSLTIPPNPSLVVSAFAANGMVGPTSLPIANAVAIGVSSSVTSTGLYTGVSVGVSSGGDVSSVVLANSVTLQAVLFTEMVSSYGGSGTSTALMAKALAEGISLLFLSGSGIGAVAPTGPVGPAPASGTSLSVVT